MASLQYSHVGISAYDERGSLAPLRFRSQGQDSLKSLIGLRAFHHWQVGGVVSTPEVRAQWVHEYLDTTATVESRFATGNTFVVAGPELGRNSLLLEAGITARISPATALSAFYTGEIGRKNFSHNAVNGGIRIEF